MSGEGAVLPSTFRVFMGDVDAARLHFGAPARWMDRAPGGWPAEVGHPLSELLRTGLGVPVVGLHCRHLARVDLDDVLDAATWLGAVGTTSFRTRHRFPRDGAPVIDSEPVHVCVDRRDGRPTPAPERLSALVVPPPAAARAGAGR